ncbi:MAG: hypothetical protein QGG71_27790, partial [Pirellulaceae bacterium]|nr:hypothetical protein [Pirellulaceae bacterium]
GTDHFKPAIFDRLMPATCPVASDRSNTARGTPPLGTAIVPRSRVGLDVACGGLQRLAGTITWGATEALGPPPAR